MRARSGDRIVITSGTVGGPTRDGEVVGVAHVDGSPPYRVRWSDSGAETLFFPGQDASIGPAGVEGSGADHLPVPVWQHVRRWSVTVDVFEHEDDTTAHAVLTTEAPATLDGRGLAHRLAGDLPVPEIGAEVATARALRELADSLMTRAEADVLAVGSR